MDIFDISLLYGTHMLLVEIHLSFGVGATFCSTQLTRFLQNNILSSRYR